MAEPFDLTVADAASQVRQGQLSPLDLMESLLERTRSFEPTLRVWATLDPVAALDAAKRSQHELKEAGPRGPLHGVPIGVKDIFYTKGMKTAAGSPIYADFVPTYDATAVRRLRDAGAIVMGKTVTTQFACGDPPPTRNPWDLGRTPAGSSSGSAVGVAARLFPAALGSQTAGSVLRPASYNGVVGLKPTFGRISKYGVVPVAWSFDTIGVLTRTVNDAAIVLGVLAGHDPQDNASASEPVPDYERALGPHGSPPRVGLMGGMFHERATPEVRSNVESVVRRLTEAGASIDEVMLPMDFDTLLAAHRVIMTVEAAAVHEQDFRSRPDDYGPKVRSLVEAGILTPGVTYVEALRARRKFQREAAEAMRPFDVLLMPTTPSPAPRDLTTTGDGAFQAAWTAGGFPAMALPSGLGESAMPLSIQLVSAPFAEEKLIAAAHWCERVLDIELAPPEEVFRPGNSVHTG